MERLEQGKIHIARFRGYATGQEKQVPHAAPASQEQHSFGQSSIPNGNLMVTSRIAPPTILLSDYELLQKNFEKLKQQNDELRMNNEKNMRRLQGIIALLHELMPNIHIPHMGQTNEGEEYRKSQGNPSRITRHGIRIETLGPNN